MKRVFGLFLILGIALFVVFKFGGFETLDPQEQAKQFRDQVQPGMDWQEVAKLNQPKKCTPLNWENPSGKSPGIKFDVDQITKAVEGGQFEEGFTFEYNFTNAIAFEVVFDPEGKVTETQDLTTMKDLLGPLAK